MSAHLSSQTMTDVIEGGGTPSEWAHVASCAKCRSQLEDARIALELATKAEVPDPPGLYWEALRRNVSRRIAEEPARRSRWGRWTPLAVVSAAAVVLAVFVVGRAPAPSEAVRALPAWSALPPVEEDDGLAVVSGLAEDELADWDEGQGLGAFVAGLSDEESEALVAALRVQRPEGEL
jgi:hypothetical protein